MSENSSKSGLIKESESNLSVTIYKDDNGLSYFNKSTGNDPFSRLSDEIMLLIFQYLPKKDLVRIATVNSRFNRIMLDEALWVRMDLSKSALTRGAIGKIFSHGLKMLRLVQARIQSPIFEPHFRIEELQTKLQYLDLSMASIDKSSLAQAAQLISTCRLLQKLSLEQLALDDAVCLEIAENKNLEVLNLALCEGLTRDGVQVISENLKYLTALNISWTRLSANAVSSLVENISPNISQLNISGMNYSLSDKHIDMLASRCQNIIELDVSDALLLCNLDPLVKLQSLKHLAISRCLCITVDSLKNLSKLRQLEKLNAEGLLSVFAMRYTLRTLPNIRANNDNSKIAQFEFF